MTRVLLWGQASYMREADQRAMRSGLQALGAEALEIATEDRPERLEGIDVIVVHSRLRVGASLLDRVPGVRLVITTTSGYDHVDVAAARERGARVARCPLARRDAVVETSVGMGLALLRDLVDLNEASQQGHWLRGKLGDRTLRTAAGLGVGIVGFGVIGRRAAEVWRALGADVAFSDPAVEGGLALADLLRRSQLVTLHCSLTDTSRHLLNATTLGLLPDGALIINTARGGCIDLDALLAAEHVGGMGLDVFPEEPYRGLRTFAGRRNIVLTPHAAGYHDGLGRAVANEVAKAVAAHVTGAAIPHEVTLEE